MTASPLSLQPVLDPDFLPAADRRRKWDAEVAATGRPVLVKVALEQSDGSIFRRTCSIFPGDHPSAAGNLFHVERFLKFLLWSRGGFRIHMAAPEELVNGIRAHYATTEVGRFDAQIMGERIYERPFEVLSVPESELPTERSATRPLGRHLDGCRIGFDLGASDVKCAAVVDGAPVFSEEFAWNPVPEKNPDYHFNFIMNVLREAARHMPRVDAIGGSSAGVYVNNRVKVASLFRSVPPDLFRSRVKDLFLEIQKAWNGIPLDVVNDGEVTALAGSMSLQSNAVLGIALGSSEAAGYVTPGGNITNWLNELAFAPVDYRRGAPADEWSGDRGCGVQYFSQQAVGRLLKPAGIDVDPALPLPEKLKHVQALMAKGDTRAEAVYRTIGCYLGHAIAHYADFYEVRHVLILGRVTSGEGGGIILREAQQALAAAYPDVARDVNFHTPSERDKRHGQAIAAASLPVI